MSRVQISRVTSCATPQQQVWETLFRGAEVCRRRRRMAGMWISRFCHGRVTGSLGWKFIACYKITGGHTTLIAQNQTLGSHASSLIQRVSMPALLKLSALRQKDSIHINSGLAASKLSEEWPLTYFFTVRTPQKHGDNFPDIV